MPGDLFSDGAMHLLEKSLTWRSRGQEVLASNLANLETPGYTGKQVNFHQVLKDHLEGRPELKLAVSHGHHLKGSFEAAALVRDTQEPPDLDREMVNLSLNQLGYQTSVTMLNKKLDQLRTVLEGNKP